MFQLPARYKPLGGSAVGGMGAVVFCQDTILERQVAIKVIQDEVDHRRMVDELEALMRVRSKHVVQVYDFLEVAGHGLGIVEEYIEGEDLLKVNGPAPGVQEFYRGIWQIASGINDIHSVGIIHRDIKPNNIKIDPEGVYKIFDFGLARTDGIDASTLGFIGTHGFAAPELYRDSVEFTNAVDVYAFGATALFLALRKLPKAMMRPYLLDIDADVNYFSLVNIPIAEHLIVILNKCISPDPKARPPISLVVKEISKCILFDSHKALVVYNGQAKHLNSLRRNINLKVEGVGDVDISYDGLRFFVSKVSGEVYINNMAVSVEYELPGSCVVALGGAWRNNSDRAFITFDLSHPEIVL